MTFPNESPEYRAARNKLLQREVALRREMEAVAAEIRALPLGGPVPEDYVLQGADDSGAIILMQRGHPRRCGCPNCSGPAPIL